tara:strand:+ start:108 stop:671 length:564 start_codon:yes stop_codon:yes gene_type:complete
MKELVFDGIPSDAIKNVLSFVPDPTGVVAPRTDTTMIQLAHGIYATRTGATIKDNVTLEDFCTGISNCQALSNAATWALGDLISYGESRNDWGEMYTQALDLTQKSYSTLTNAVYVSNAYPPEERVDGLSWSHHREIASLKNLDERRTLLTQAVDEGWSREQLRDAAKGSRASAKKVTTCPKCGHEW